MKKTVYQSKISICLTSEQYKAVSQAAKKDGRTISEVIRDLVRNFQEKQQ